MKKSLILVAFNDLSRQLLMNKINNNCNINFLGSFGADKALFRACSIYKPNIVIVFVYDDNKAEVYNCVRKIRKLSKDTNLIVIDTNYKDYEPLLYYKYGASNFYGVFQDINSIIKENLSVVHINNALNTIRNNNLIKLKMEKPPIKYWRYWLYLTSLYFSESKWLFLHDFPQFKKKVYYLRLKLRERSVKQAKSIVDLVKSGWFPKDSRKVVDYLHLYPEKFFIYKYRPTGEDLLFILFTYSLRKKVAKLCQKEVNLGEFRGKIEHFQDYFFDVEKTKTTKLNMNLRQKEVKNDEK